MGERREIPRKLIHIAFGFLAFAVAFLGPLGSALMAASAVAFNAFVLPRVGGRLLWRADELERGRSVGILLYPVSVLVLVLVFRQRLEVAAAAWGILAFGDGMAALVGSTLGGRRLPWNRRKSWLGSLSYWVFGGLGAAALLGWTLTHQASPPPVSWPFLAAAAAVAAAISAGLESQPQGLDDNLGVPLVTGLVLFGLMSSEGYWTSEIESAALLTAVVTGLGVNLALGVLALKARSIDVSGVVAGTAVGTAIYAFLGWRGFLLLGAFFVLGTGATKLGYRRKAELGLAQESGGRRSARHAVANAGVAAAAAVFAATTPHAELYLPAFAAAFAAAAADTLESEIGQLWGRRTVLLTTFEPVPRGTDGAVSFAGTAAGIAGAALVAVLGWAVGFYSLAGVVVVTVAGFTGSVCDSLLGATLERRGLLDNEAVNFSSTLAAALTGAGLTAILP